MTINLSGIGTGADLLRAACRRLARWTPRALRRARHDVVTDPSYETALRTTFAARGWTFLLCAHCGHVADWVIGDSHNCQTKPSPLPEDGARRAGRAEDAEDAGCGALFDEIDEYLTSRDGRYDALVAALIIRSR